LPREWNLAISGFEKQLEVGVPGDKNVTRRISPMAFLERKRLVIDGEAH
jgi:hypothetical protein